MNLLEILANKKIIKAGDVAGIQKLAADNKQSIEQVLVAKGIPPIEILTAVGQYYEMPTKQVGSGSIPNEILGYIPEESAVLSVE